VRRRLIRFVCASKWKASRFAATLRRRLYKEHLGLLPPQSNSLQLNEPTRSMLPVNVPQEDELGSREDQLVADPMGRELEEMWNGRASVNTEAFNKVFRCVPAAGILNWKDYAGKSHFHSRTVFTSKKRDLIFFFAAFALQNTCPVAPMLPRCATLHHARGMCMRSR
jgi:hypothetical protein